MSNAEIAQSCFDNLPKIKECWVTKDGNYHLHGVHGGEHFERDVKQVIEPTETKEAEIVFGKKKKK